MTSSNIEVTVESAIGVLPCRAIVRKAMKSDEVSAAVRFGKGYFYPVKSGDIVVECVNSCAAFDKCPLVKSLMLDGRAEIKLNAVWRDPVVNVDGPSAAVDNPDMEGNAEVAATVSAKTFILDNRGNVQYLSSPRLAMRFDGKEDGNAGSDRRDTCEDCGQKI